MRRNLLKPRAHDFDGEVGRRRLLRKNGAALPRMIIVLCIQISCETVCVPGRTIILLERESILAVEETLKNVQPLCAHDVD
jgi:hypothetical protein